MVKKVDDIQNSGNIVAQIKNFLGRRYIWSGLIIGFLWSFFTPFVLTIFLQAFLTLSENVKWILFFPLKLSFIMTEGIINLDLIDPTSWIFILWITSILVGMFVCVIITYIIHLIFVWRTRSVNTETI